MWNVCFLPQCLCGFNDFKWIPRRAPTFDERLVAMRNVIENHSECFTLSGFLSNPFGWGGGLEQGGGHLWERRVGIGHAGGRGEWSMEAVVNGGRAYGWVGGGAGCDKCTHLRSRSGSFMNPKTQEVFFV